MNPKLRALEICTLDLYSFYRWNSSAMCITQHVHVHVCVCVHVHVLFSVVSDVRVASGPSLYRLLYESFVASPDKCPRIHVYTCVVKLSTCADPHTTCKWLLQQCIIGRLGGRVVK